MINRPTHPIIAKRRPIMLEKTFTCDDCGDQITLQTEWPNQIDETVLENNGWSLHYKTGERFCKNHTKK